MRLIEGYRRLRAIKSPSIGLISDLLLVLVFLAVLRNLFVESSFVLSDSMEPTLKPGDWLLVDKLRYLGGGPVRGDIVVFNAPLEPGEEYVKRVVAVPGDTVQLEGGRLRLNGVLVREPYLMAEGFDGPSTTGDENPFAEPVLLPEGMYLVLGDNRSNSKDSRTWGLLAGEEILGRAELVYFSYAQGAGSADGVRWDRMSLPLY